MPSLCICVGMIVLTLSFPMSNAAHHETTDLRGSLANFFDPVTPHDHSSEISEATELQENFAEPSVSEDVNVDENDSANRIIIGLRDENETGNKDVEIDVGENKPDMTFEGNEFVVDNGAEIDLDLGLDIHMKMRDGGKAANVQPDRPIDHMFHKASFHDMDQDEPVLDKIRRPIHHSNHKPVNRMLKRPIHAIHTKPVPQKTAGFYVPTINHKAYKSGISYVQEHKHVPKLVSRMMGHYDAKYGNTYSSKHVNGKDHYSLPKYGKDDYSISKHAKGYSEHARGKDNYSSHGYEKMAKATYGKDNSKLEYDMNSYSKSGHEKRNYSKSGHRNDHSKHAVNYDYGTEYSRPDHGKNKYSREHSKRSTQANYYSNLVY